MKKSFCGNPFNHPPHEDEDVKCEGVGREEQSETVVERYTPDLETGSDMAEDGTQYQKITILIEDKKTGHTTIVEVPEGSYPMFLPRYVEHIDLEKDTPMPDPRIEVIRFEFQARATDEAPAFKITRMTDGK